MPSVHGLALAQRRAGHQVELWYDTKRGNMGGVEEVARPHLGSDFPHQPLTLSTKSTPLEWIRDCAALSRFIKTEEPDVLHVHLSHDHVLAKTVTKFSDSSPLLIRTVHARRSLAKRFGQALLYRDLDGLIFRSSDHLSQFRRHFGDATPSCVVPSGIELERFSPTSAARKSQLRQARSLPEGARVICHAGLIADRGQVELLRAVHALSDPAIWLMYIGGGEQEAVLDDLITALGMSSRVIRTGYLDGEALVDAYRCSDLAFVGRLGNDAGGRIALEPMGCGIPVLGNTDGALETIVRSEYGWPCAKLDEEEIARQLKRALAASSEDLASMGERARAWVEQHRSFSSEAAESVAFYENLLSR